jgi:glycolate oxidase
LIGLEGSSEVVERHLKEINTMAQNQGAAVMVTIEDKKADAVWRSYRKVSNLFNSKNRYAFTAKASVPIMKSGEMFKAAKESGRHYSMETGIQAHCGNGIVYLYVPAKKEDAINMFQELAQAARGLGGLLTLETAPLWVRENRDIWPVLSAYALMGRLKAALDPNNILNPGKIIGGQ